MTSHPWGDTAYIFHWMYKAKSWKSQHTSTWITQQIHNSHFFPPVAFRFSLCDKHIDSLQEFVFSSAPLLSLEGGTRAPWWLHRGLRTVVGCRCDHSVAPQTGMVPLCLYSSVGHLEKPKGQQYKASAISSDILENNAVGMSGGEMDFCMDWWIAFSHPHNVRVGNTNITFRC